LADVLDWTLVRVIKLCAHEFGHLLVGEDSP